MQSKYPTENVSDNSMGKFHQLRTFFILGEGSDSVTSGRLGWGDPRVWKGRSALMDWVPEWLQIGHEKGDSVKCDLGDLQNKKG